MKLKSLYLENFQPFEKVTFDFDPHLNSIEGPSNVGKSSIIRALCFLFFNEWDSSYVRKGSNLVKVRGVFDDNTVIEREKGSSVNRLTLITPEGQKHVFENFGVELPDIVKRKFSTVLEIDGVSVNVNVSNQEDPYFLIGFPPSLRSKIVSRLVGMDVLQKALDFVSSDIQKLQAEKRYVQQNISTFEKKLSECTSIDSTLKRLENLSSCYSQIESKYSLYLDLSRCVHELSKYKSQIERLDRHLSVKPLIEKSLAQIDLYFSLREYKNRLDSLCQEREYLELRLNNFRTQFKSLLETYEKSLRSLRVCPVCGSTFTESKIKQVVSELESRS